MRVVRHIGHFKEMHSYSQENACNRSIYFHPVLLVALDASIQGYAPSYVTDKGDDRESIYPANFW
jgi:hypothetical protein